MQIIPPLQHAENVSEVLSPLYTAPVNNQRSNYTALFLFCVTRMDQ
jgi:hypothetical protein